uniref:Putative tail protein n=1 Tax=viral metagenome TaxID=1070528 RepID=A0A6H1ZE89_9ZZZZ
MNTSFVTEKGTTLPLLDLRGKPYLQVAHRIVWFREEYPDWAIETQHVSLTDTKAIYKAAIKDETGRVIATATKSEDKSHFNDFIEKAETGAIGRALALCGFGTQFTGDELEEGGRIVDSPIEQVIPVQPMMDKLPTTEAPACPKCGAKTVWKAGVSKRTNREYAFWGCPSKNPNGTWCGGTVDPKKAVEQNTSQDEINIEDIPF